VTQAYVLGWSDGKLRFYTNGGRIESGPGSPYEVSTPYSAAEAPFVSHQQSYDRLYLAHGSHPPASLLRLTATTFSYAALTLKNGPFADRNTNEAITVTASGTTGSVTITANRRNAVPRRARRRFLHGRGDGLFGDQGVGAQRPTSTRSRSATCAARTARSIAARISERRSTPARSSQRTPAARNGTARARRCSAPTTTTPASSGNISTTRSASGRSPASPARA
jgi:hypothetical protein